MTQALLTVLGIMFGMVLGTLAVLVVMWLVFVWAVQARDWWEDDGPEV